MRILCVTIHNNNVFYKQTSKRSVQHVYGRNDANIKVIIPAHYKSGQNDEVAMECLAGDWVRVRVEESNSQVLKAVPLRHTQLL